MQTDRHKLNSNILTFNTSGDWTSDELRALLEGVSIIYNVFLSVKLASDFNKNIQKFKLKDLPKLTAEEIYKDVGHYVDREAKLKIDKVQMASPGLISFIGSGEIIEKVKDFFVAALTFDQVRKKNKHDIEKTIIENDVKIEELRSTELRNIQTIIAIFKECGFSSDEIQEFIRPSLGASNSIHLHSLGGRLKIVENSDSPRIKKSRRTLKR